jgi:hypothetical protein
MKTVQGSGKELFNLRSAWDKIIYLYRNRLYERKKPIKKNKE